MTKRESIFDFTLFKYSQCASDQCYIARFLQNIPQISYFAPISAQKMKFSNKGFFIFCVVYLNYIIVHKGLPAPPPLFKSPTP